MKKRTMQNILLLTVLTLFLCACLVGCVGVVGNNNDVGVNTETKQSPNEAEDTPKAGDTDNTTDQPDTKTQSAEVYIERITNYDGGVINIYYTVRENSGEEWQGEIRFDSNGGVAPNGATMSWDKNKQYVNLACPFVREGYLFCGWSLDRSGVPHIYPTNDHFAAYPISEIVALAKSNDKIGDLTFYAIWGQNCTITYDANRPAGATATVAGMPAHNPAVWEYGQSVVLAQAPSLAGWHFGGWYQDAACQTKVGDAGEILPSNRNIQGSVRLYAKWQVDSYDITFDLQGGIGGTTKKSVTYGSAMPGISIPTLTGHIFGGYYTGTNGTGTQYYDPDGNSVRKWDLAEDMMLYAKWAIDCYSVMLDAATNGGSCATGSVQVVYNGTYGSLPNASKSDYRFLGWFTQPSGGTKVESNTLVTDTKPHTLYAQFDQTISYLDTKLLSCSIDNGYNYTQPDQNANNYHFSYKHEFGKFVIKNTAKANQSSFELNQSGGSAVYFRVTYDCGNLPRQDSMTSRFVSNDNYSSGFYNMPGGDIGNRTVQRGLLVAYITYEDGTLPKRIIRTDIFNGKHAGDEVLIVDGIDKPCKIEIAICIEFEMWAPGFLGISDNYWMNYRINQTLNFK